MRLNKNLIYLTEGQVIVHWFSVIKVVILNGFFPIKINKTINSWALKAYLEP